MIVTASVGTFNKNYISYEIGQHYSQSHHIMFSLKPSVVKNGDFICYFGKIQHAEASQKSCRNIFDEVVSTLDIKPKITMLMER